MSNYDAESETANLINQSRELQERTQALSAEHEALSVEFDRLAAEGGCSCQSSVTPAAATGQ